MVPQVARAVLDQACHVHPDITRVGDPFSGSGTILTESIMRGLDFTGTDINPLAILLCRVKAGPFFVGALAEKTDELLGRIEQDRRWAIEADFPNRNKWFTREVQIGLSKIRRAIRDETSSWARRFFWVALAETVRFTSNSRTSTFKLHIRKQDDIDARDVDPITIFTKIVRRNLSFYEDQAKQLQSSGYLAQGHYRGDVCVSLRDVRTADTDALCDVILTSPPYGDNTTTVPYGQYSYLPLQWIDLEDIGGDVDSGCLDSTHEIDSRSLGGRRRLGERDVDQLKERSRAFRRYVDALQDQPRNRTVRVTAFFRDLDSCLRPILQSLRPGGLMVWTLGNRRVGGKRVPLDTILSELLDDHDAHLLCKLRRRIHSKRMAPKNSVAKTMSTESILVMRKANR